LIYKDETLFISISILFELSKKNSFKKQPTKLHNEYQEYCQKYCCNVFSIKLIDEVRKAFLNLECDLSKMIDNFFLYPKNFFNYVYKEKGKDIEPYQFEMVAESIQEIAYFEKMKFTEHKHNYRTEIKRLKMCADDLQRLSTEQITINIPMRPIDIRHILMIYLRIEGVKKEVRIEIDNILKYILKMKRNIKFGSTKIGKIFKLYDKPIRKKTPTFTDIQEIKIYRARKVMR